ncbi:MAG: STAS domain-containing protein [Williamsia sp.]|nr:STAS domain-containing protein [Williamsia sp.]
MRQSPYQVQLQGDFVARKALQVKQELHQLIEQGHDNLLLDLTSVHEVDIAGINALAGAYKKLRGREGNLQLKIARNSQPARMLHITKFDLLLPYTLQ